MCKISFERCVCFIFIVVLAILSCSGFPIDRSTMGALSQTNSLLTSSSLSSNRQSDFVSRLLPSNYISRYKRDAHGKFSSERHRIRHARKLRNREQNRQQTGRIESRSDFDDTNAKFSTLTPNQQWAQIQPAGDFQQQEPLRPTPPLKPSFTSSEGRRNPHRDDSSRNPSQGWPPSERLPGFDRPSSYDRSPPDRLTPVDKSSLDESSSYRSSLDTQRSSLDALTSYRSSSLDRSSSEIPSGNPPSSERPLHDRSSPSTRRHGSNNRHRQKRPSLNQPKTPSFQLSSPRRSPFEIPRKTNFDSPSRSSHLDLPPSGKVSYDNERSSTALTSSEPRSQRSAAKNNQRKNQGGGGGKKNRNHRCQQQDIARKAFKADIVVLAEAQSMSSDRVKNYSVSFKVLKIYKTKEKQNPKVNMTIRLDFTNNTKKINCESELETRSLRPVKAQIKPFKEYFLFLNSDGGHNYSVYGTPVMKKPRKNQENQIYKVVRELKVRDPNVALNVSSRTPHTNGNVTLTCNVRGFPPPIITWRKDNEPLHPRDHLSINYKRKSSVLKIKKMSKADYGLYECVASGMTNKAVSKNITITDPNSENLNGKPCPRLEDSKTFCNGNGRCLQVEIHGVFCECYPGYKGQYCSEKDVTENSRYQTVICKLGMSTTYYC